MAIYYARTSVSSPSYAISPDDHVTIRGKLDNQLKRAVDKCFPRHLHSRVKAAHNFGCNHVRSLSKFNRIFEIRGCSSGLSSSHIRSGCDCTRYCIEVRDGRLIINCTVI
jgi:hypothetical protein